MRAVAKFVPEAMVVDVRMPPTFTDEGRPAPRADTFRWLRT